MENIFVKILMLVFIIIIVYLLYHIFNNINTHKCQIENFDIDNMVVTKRTPEYSKLINNLVDEKSFIFTDEQIKVLKNPQQIFNVTNNSNDITNISDIIYTDCKGNLDNQVNQNYNDELIDVSDNEYNNIQKMLKYDINELIGPNCSNIGVLNDIPPNKNYLKNYYQDLYGNKIEANLSDYFSAYYTLINENDNVGLPVNTLLGHSNFIIPDQYKYVNKLTNAYNIDWERIINPIGYSM